MLSLSTLRRELEGTTQVAEKFKSDGEFTIDLETFAGISDVFSCDTSDVLALVDELGGDTALFRVVARDHGSSMPIVVTAMAYASGNEVELRAADLKPIEGKVTASRIGPGGYVVAKIGKASVQIPMVVSDDLRDALISLRNDGIEAPQFSETKGLPPLVIGSPFDDQPIRTVKEVPQRDLPPHADIVPQNSDLTVMAVLEPSRKYGSPRLRVKTEAGEIIEGLIATQPIVRCISGQYEGAVDLDESVVGQKFQIVDVEDRRRRDGELVKGEDGKVQKTVIVRNTTTKREFKL